LQFVYRIYTRCAKSDPTAHWKNAESLEKFINDLKGVRLNQCFPSLLASAPFSDKQISIAPLPCLAHISKQFFRALHYKT